METGKKVVLLCTVIFSFVLTASGQLQDSPWPMYSHDLQHTGQSQYASNLVPGLGWSYRVAPTSLKAVSPPYVDSSVRIYIGSGDNRLYCLN